MADNFGTLISSYRRVLGLKQIELANVLNIRRRQEIGQIENIDDISQLSDKNLFKYLILVTKIKESNIFSEMIITCTDYLYKILLDEYNNRFNKKDMINKIIKYRNNSSKK